MENRPKIRRKNYLKTLWPIRIPNLVKAVSHKPREQKKNKETQIWWCYNWADENEKWWNNETEKRDTALRRWGSKCVVTQNTMLFALSTGRVTGRAREHFSVGGQGSELGARSMCSEMVKVQCTFFKTLCSLNNAPASTRKWWQGKGQQY